MVNTVSSDGGISNLCPVDVPDLLPPGTASDVQAVDLQDNARINVTFTGPGDDGERGTPATYDLRYAFADWDLTNETFWSAPRVPTEALVIGGFRPVPAGEKYNVMLSGFALPLDEKRTVIGRHVFFAVSAADEAGNQGPVSRCGDVWVEDYYPPNGVKNLRARGPFETGFLLSFEESGDDYTTGIGRKECAQNVIITLVCV